MNRDWMLDKWAELDDIATRGMTSPVRCAYCSQVYDLGTVTVTARYADCSVWKSPCCDRTVDDRGETGWKSTKDYYPLTRRILTMPRPDRPRYLRTGEAADILQVSPKTVARWVKEGKLPALKTLGGHARLPEAEIRALMAANTVPVSDASVRRLHT